MIDWAGHNTARTPHWDGPRVKFFTSAAAAAVYIIGRLRDRVPITLRGAYITLW